MKRLVFYTTVLLLIFTAAGCSKGDKKINADDVKESTLLARTNGEIQVATIEGFDKEYYSLNELQNFVDEQIAAYNSKAGDNRIKVDSVQLADDKAVMLLTYSGMDQYTAFNEVTAAYFNGGVKDLPFSLPATLVNSKNEALASTQEIIQNNKYKVLILNEPYHIVVDGKIKYFSDNAKLIDDNEVQAPNEGMTIVVFKP